MEPRKITTRIATTPEDFSLAKLIILEYVDQLEFDLSFQNFSDEINALDAMYSAPTGGLLIATVDMEAAGVAGVRQFDFENKSAELKRMFVRPQFRGLGLGRMLLLESVALGRQLGYTTIKLDTADYMKDAIQLYQRNGFVEIPPYRYNPQSSARYFELKL